MRESKVIEIHSLISYVREHMKLFVNKENLPWLVLNGDGKEIILAFSAEGNQREAK